jgi:hypothetical protein
MIAAILPAQKLGPAKSIPGSSPGLSKQTYSTYRLKLDAASRVQPTIPANISRFTRAGQEDSQVQSPTKMGRNKIQIIISATIGNACTQFQSKLSHSRLITSAIANPTHSSTKIRMAYVLSTLGTITSQNFDFSNVVFL